MHSQSSATNLHFSSDSYDMSQDSSNHFSFTSQNNLTVYPISLSVHNVTENENSIITDTGINSNINTNSNNINFSNHNVNVKEEILSSPPSVNEFLKFDKLLKELLHSQIKREQYTPTHLNGNRNNDNNKNDGYTYNVSLIQEDNTESLSSSLNANIKQQHQQQDPASQDPRNLSFPLVSSHIDNSQATIVSEHEYLQNNDNINSNNILNEFSTQHFFPQLQQQQNHISPNSQSQSYFENDQHAIPSHLPINFQHQQQQHQQQQQQQQHEQIPSNHGPLPFLILNNSNVSTPSTTHSHQPYPFFHMSNSGSDSIITPTRATFNDEYHSLKSPIPEFTNSSRSSVCSMDFPGLNLNLSEDLRNETNLDQSRRVSLDANLCRKTSDKNVTISTPNSATRSHFTNYEINSFDNNNDSNSIDDINSSENLLNKDINFSNDPFERVEIKHSSSATSPKSLIRQSDSSSSSSTIQENNNNFNELYTTSNEELQDLKNNSISHNASFSSSTSVSSLKKNSNGIFQCSSCLKSFTRKSNLTKHVEIVHYKRPKLICPYCKQSKCARKSDLQRHIKTKHQGELTKIIQGTNNTAKGKKT